MRSPILIEHDGRITTMISLSRRSGLNYWTLYSRWRAGQRGNRLVRAVKARSPKRPA
jgi:hypothetical protein